MLKTPVSGSPKNNRIKKNNSIKWLAIAVVICFAFSIGGAVVYGFASLAKPVTAIPGEAVIITVRPGMTATDIAQKLHENGLIRNYAVFRLASKIGKLDSSLKAGEYSLHTGMSVNEIIAIISEGRVTYYQFTIPEGYTVNQIANLLEEKNFANAERFRELAKTFAPYPYMVNDNPLLIYKAEGFLFPDTYRVAAGVSEEQLLAMMTNQFDRIFTPDMRQKANELGLSWHDVFTLASIVEREAMLAEERPIIAAVFLNRLRIGMPLQSCATIQYILGNPKAVLTIADTRIPSPYNTYQNMGLPPGPIANPGRASIAAVLQNEQTDNLFFVADSKGRHHFGRTYQEHLRNISRVESGSI